MTVLCCCRPGLHEDRISAVSQANVRALASPLRPLSTSRLHPSPATRQLSARPPSTAESASKPAGIINAIPVHPVHRGPTDLDQLEIDESDGGDDQIPLGKRASVTWTAVCSRLTRHISLEGTFKKQTPSLTGHSQEEIARRAELKRLMHRRIQDELLCDEDTADDDPAAQSAVHKPSVSNIGQSWGGPRDTIEFIVKKKEQTKTSSDSDLYSGIDDHIGTGRNAEPSAVGLARGEQPDAELASFAERLSQVVEAIQEGRDECAEGSFLDLKQTCDTPGECNGATSQVACPRGEREKSNSGDSQSWETHSVLAMWLKSQGTRSREPSFARLDDSEACPTIPAIDRHMPQEACVKTHALPDSRGHMNMDPRTVMSTESQTSSAIETHQTLPPPPQPAARGDKPANKSGSSEGKIFTLSPSQDLAQSYAVAMAFDNTEEAPSSAYPSSMPSMQTSPMTSQTNIFYNLNSRDLHSIQLSSLPWKDDQSENDSKSQHSRDGSEMTAKQAAQSFQEHESHRSQLTLDTISVAPTESASFQQREMELNSIEKRFGGSVPRKKPPTMVRSRFREEFNQPPRPSSRRGTLMAKVHRSFERRSKTQSGSTDDTRVAALPSPLTGMVHSSEGKMAYGDAGNTTSGSLSARWKTRLPVAHHRLKGNSSVSVTEAHSAMQTSHPTQVNLPRALASQHSDKNTTLLASDRIDDTDASAAIFMDFAQAKDSTPPKMTPLNARLVFHSGASHGARLPDEPNPWARFPSDTREERNGSAVYERDSVRTHNFAFDAVGSSAAGYRRVSTPASSRIPQSRSSKLGRRVKSGLSRMLPFLGHDGDLMTEEAHRAGDRLHSSSRPKSSVPADIATSVTLSNGSDERVLDRVPSTVSHGSLPDMTGDQEQHSNESVASGENGSTITVHRSCVPNGAIGSQSLAQTSCIALTDVFLTPLGGSLANGSSEALEGLSTRSRTCPDLSRAKAHSLHDCLPVSHSCPTSILRMTVNQIHTPHPVLPSKESIL